MNYKSAKPWLILGILLVSTGFILAHLSNANLIRWAYGLEYVADFIFHKIGFLFILIGIVIALVKKFKK